MGLLKHFVLPFFAVIHGWVAFTVILGDRASLTVSFDWPASENEGLTLYENHALGILGGCHAAFFFAAIVGVVQEHSHFRAVLAMMELIFWTYGGFDAAQLGFPCYAAYFFAFLAGVGLLVNMKEPGLFTKDTGATNKKD
jgi:hypothetical protein